MVFTAAPGLSHTVETQEPNMSLLVCCFFVLFCFLQFLRNTYVIVMHNTCSVRVQRGENVYEFQHNPVRAVEYETIYLCSLHFSFFYPQINGRLLTYFQNVKIWTNWLSDRYQPWGGGNYQLLVLGEKNPYCAFLVLGINIIGILNKIMRFNTSYFSPTHCFKLNWSIFWVVMG